MQKKTVAKKRAAVWHGVSRSGNTDVFIRRHRTGDRRVYAEISFQINNESPNLT